MSADYPRDDLYRGLRQAPEVRDGGEDSPEGAPSADQAAMGTTITGHFAVFDTWTEIDSWYEGRFLERIVKGAFRKTLRENLADVRCQFDHGGDDYIGSAPLGPIQSCVEDDFGVAYSVPLLDTDYNRDRILPLLSGRLMDGTITGESLLGASFRFRVIKDEWVMEPKPSASNPTALPERTIREVRLYEFGPVVWPAYPEATAMCSSLTDHYQERRLRRNGGAARAAERLRPAAMGTGIAASATEPARSHSPSGLPLSLALAIRARLAIEESFS